MAIIDVIQWETEDGVLAFKFPSDDLSGGSQLIVHPAQTAFFVKGGRIYDEFAEGTYTLTNENIPLLNKIINLPFGNDSPFKAEVWFINQTVKLNQKWGIPQLVQIEDPKYHIIVPLMANGQYGIRVSNPRLFLTTLIGNKAILTSSTIDDYFKGIIVSMLCSFITEKIIIDKVSLLDIGPHIKEFSDFCGGRLNESFTRYGIEILEFSIISISIPEKDPGFLKLKEAKAKMASLAITGKEYYQMERSFDVLEKAASNEGAAGQLAGLGIGLGAASGIGGTFKSIAERMNVNPVSPPPIPTQQYFIIVNGEQIGNQSIENIKQLIHQGIVTGSSLMWRSGLDNWEEACKIPELVSLFVPPVPPKTV